MVTQDFYGVPHNHLILNFNFWLTSEAVLWTSEARRQASVWTKQLKGLLINEIGGRITVGNNNIIHNNYYSSVHRSGAGQSQVKCLCPNHAKTRHRSITRWCMRKRRGCWRGYNPSPTLPKYDIGIWNAK